MPSPSQSLSAVIVSGGKQYRVAPGDRILVDRLAAEAGSELTLARVLLVADGDEVKVGPAGLDGLTVTARVLGHRRGPKVDVLRYKSKKRVRVHRGARADLTALEILTIGGKGGAASSPRRTSAGVPAELQDSVGAVNPENSEKAAAKAEEPVAANAEQPEPKAPRTRAKAAPKKEAEEAPETDGA